MRPTAAALGLPHLYHYEPFVEEYLTATLQNQRVHRSQPGNLNDPWDCRPSYNLEPFLGDAQQLDRLCEYLLAKRKPEPMRDKVEHLLRTNPEFLRQMIAGLSNAACEALSTRSIYCLTPDPISTLMWSHYAKNHKGICLEFNVNNPFIGIALQVNYLETYPVFLPHDEHGVIETVLTKSNDWAYEREFRVIHFDNRPLEDGAFFPLPKGALASVIIGCEAKEPLRIAEIVKKFAPNVAVKRAVRIPNHFRLQLADWIP